MDVLSLLETYHQVEDGQGGMKRQFLAFISAHPDHLLRSCISGHLTGSAFIVDRQAETVLLVHHRKLDKWLQPGGHADGDPDMLRVAMRESQEETGLEDLRLLQDGIFDLDIHTIPARAGEPEHLHLDMRFLFGVDSKIPLTVSRESLDAKWFRFENVRECMEASIVRMVKKVMRS